MASNRERKMKHEQIFSFEILVRKHLKPRNISENLVDSNVRPPYISKPNLTGFELIESPPPERIPEPEGHLQQHRRRRRARAAEGHSAGLEPPTALPSFGIR